jgi:hypothetical protein
MRIPRIVIVLAVGLSFLAGQWAFAQAEGNESGRIRLPREGRGFFMIGLQNTNLSDLNGPMVSQGYSRFGENFALIGGGGYGIMGRVMIGGEGYALIDREASRGPAAAKLSAGCGFFDLGYILWRDDRFMAYGMLGLGGGGWSLRITDSAAESFEAVLVDPGRSSTLSTGGFLASLSVGADWYLRIGGDERGEGGMFVGLRAGYTAAPFKSGWEMEDFEITSGPKMGLGGPFVRLVIGFGGRGVD